MRFNKYDVTFNQCDMTFNIFLRLIMELVSLKTVSPSSVKNDDHLK